MPCKRKRSVVRYKISDDGARWPSHQPYAHVIAWESPYQKLSSGEPRVIVPEGRIINPREVPEFAPSVWIVQFNSKGKAVNPKWIPRSALSKYRLVG